MEKIINKCPVCEETSAKQFFEIKGVPVMVNVPSFTPEEAKNAKRGDITLKFCQNCGHIFNSVFNPESIEYNEYYENPLHYSSRFKEYNAELIVRLIKTYNIQNKKVMDIGGGRGHFLDLLCKEGANDGICLDPGCGEEQTQKSSGSMTFIKDFYSQKYRDYKADFICCRQVLEHIYSPRQFLDLIHHAILEKTNSIVFFEVPNADYVFKDLGIWDLLYEHYSYFNKSSLRYVFEASGFGVCNLFEAYKDQYLCIEAKPAITRIEENNYDTEKIAYSLEGFEEKYQKKIGFWKQKLKDLKRANKKIVVWGAGTKGVMFLNMLKIQDEVEYAVDINPNKQGKYIVGTGQEIIAPEFLREYRPDAVIIMNSIYKDEITQSLNKLDINTGFLYA